MSQTRRPLWPWYGLTVAEVVATAQDYVRDAAETIADLSWVEQRLAEIAATAPPGELVAALSHPAPEVRRWAARAIAERGITHGQ